MRSLWNRPWGSESREHSCMSEPEQLIHVEEISSRHTASTSASALPDDVLIDLIGSRRSRRSALRGSSSDFIRGRTQLWMSMPFRAWTRRSQDLTAAMGNVCRLRSFEKFQSHEETATVLEGHPPQNGHCPHEDPLVGSCSEDILEAPLVGVLTMQECSIAKRGIRK